MSDDENICPSCMANPSSGGEPCDSCKEVLGFNSPVKTGEKTVTVFIRREVEMRGTGEWDGGVEIEADYYTDYSRDDIYDVFDDGTEALISSGDEYVSDEGWV